MQEVGKVSVEGANGFVVAVFFGYGGEGFALNPCFDAVGAEVPAGGERHGVDDAARCGSGVFAGVFEVELGFFARDGEADVFGLFHGLKVVMMLPMMRCHCQMMMAKQRDWMTIAVFMVCGGGCMMGLRSCR